MEINTQNIEALMRVQEQQAQRKTGEASQDFNTLLFQELSADSMGGAASVPGTPQAQMISQILLDSGQHTDTSSRNAAFDQASGALDLWDAYARSIGGGQASLRDAYSILEGIDSKVSRLRQDTAGLQGRNTGLDDVLNQLEIMTATEKFKFNRGDYNI